MAKKAAIIRQVESGRLQCEVAREFSISKQTVSDYLKNKGNIKEAEEKVSAGKQKDFRDGSHPKLEEALNMWLSATVAKWIPVSGDLLRQTITPSPQRGPWGDAEHCWEFQRFI
ncbi:hypothetical protein HPB50_012019 [Hyalomma asiaticum]|uniref:Uncharacterized protein n=1 Tax=Hyalomma asiaticum TaxID=266040 RepID=A0ACB7TGV1_HYAAI|nr:hypothetical protein HPB50_012019 [Hyalomma asiaticum]